MIFSKNVAYLINNHHVSVAKQANIETLTLNKDRHIISEIRGFFAESDNTRAIQWVGDERDGPYPNYPATDGVCQSRELQVHGRADLPSGGPVPVLLHQESPEQHQEEMMRAVVNNNNKELRAVRRAFEALQLAA